MNNKLPQGFQDLTSKNISKKAHKLVSILFTGKCAEGRIKRMRTRRESRYVKLDKRVGKRAYSFNSDFCSNLTRWNRH